MSAQHKKCILGYSLPNLYASEEQEESSFKSSELRLRRALPERSAESDEIDKDKQYALGLRYFDEGRFEKAFISFTEAASEDHAKSQYQLGVLFEFGLGVKKSASQASSWYSKCLTNDKGNQAAITRLKGLKK